MIPKDKVLHLAAGFVVGLVVRLAGGPIGSGFVAAIFTGAGKEGWDWWKNKEARKEGLPEPHFVEFADAGWTALGGAAAEAVVFLIFLLGGR